MGTHSYTCHCSDEAEHPSLDYAEQAALLHDVDKHTLSNKHISCARRRVATHLNGDEVQHRGQAATFDHMVCTRAQARHSIQDHDVAYEVEHHEGGRGNNLRNMVEAAVMHWYECQQQLIYRC